VDGADSDAISALRCPHPPGAGASYSPAPGGCGHRSSERGRLSGLLRASELRPTIQIHQPMQPKFTFNSLLLVLLCTCGSAHAASFLPLTPPANDNFADATVITATPFSDGVTTVAASLATLETGEPSCVSALSYWYTYTPTASGSYRLATEITGSFEPTPDNDVSLAVYRGDALANLFELRCDNQNDGFGGGEVTFLNLEGGQRYYFRVALVNANNTADVITTSLTKENTLGWLGTLSDDWSDPANWTGNLVPTAADVVIIDGTSANPCVVRSVSGAPFTATARSIFLSDRSLTITAGNTLSVAKGTTGVGVDGANGALNVAGNLNVTEMTEDGIRVFGDATMTVSGTVNISHAHDDGWQIEGGSLNYSSTTSQINNINDNGFVVNEEATADFTVGSALLVTDCRNNAGLTTTGSTFTLGGTFTGRNSADAGFANFGGGELIITEDGVLDLANSARGGYTIAHFTNNGTISITGTGSGDGINTEEDCVNNGSIFLSGIGADGIDIEDDSLFTNNGYIEIGQTGDLTIESGTFINNAGATLVTNGRIISELDLANGSRLEVGADVDTLAFPEAVTLGGTLALEIEGTGSGGTDFDQIIFSDALDLGGTTLELSGSYTPQIGDVFTICSSGGTAPTGNFVGLPEGATVVLNGTLLTISYQDGAGNDVVLTATAVLPLDLLVFTGERHDKVNDLRWTTANEEGFSHFTVQRSSAEAGASPNSSADRWEVLGAVAGAGQGQGAETPLSPGEGLGERSYTFTDTAPLTDNFYRLKMVDLDGSFSYSHIVRLGGPTQATLRVFPNPTDGALTAALPQVDGPLNLALYTIHGTRVRAQKIAPGTTNLTVEDGLRPGVYLLVVEASGERWTERVVVR